MGRTKRGRAVSVRPRRRRVCVGVLTRHTRGIRAAPAVWRSSVGNARLTRIGSTPEVMPAKRQRTRKARATPHDAVGRRPVGVVGARNALLTGITRASLVLSRRPARVARRTRLPCAWRASAQPVRRVRRGGGQTHEPFAATPRPFTAPPAPPPTQPPAAAHMAACAALSMRRAFPAASLTSPEGVTRDLSVTRYRSQPPRQRRHTRRRPGWARPRQSSAGHSTGHGPGAQGRTPARRANAAAVRRNPPPLERPAPRGPRASLKVCSRFAQGWPEALAGARDPRYRRNRCGGRRAMAPR